MFGEALYRINHARCWARSVTVAGLRMRACSADRLAYLWCHKLGLLGREDDRVLAAHLKPGMCAIDVGANLGLMSLTMARLVGPTGRVTAIEPDDLLYDTLRANLAVNDATNVTPVHAAAGAYAGRGVLHRAPLHTGDHRMYPASGNPARGNMHGLETSSSRGNRLSMEVDVLRLDDLPDAVVGQRGVDFVKIDVQGYEAQVIAGMDGLVARCPNVHIMFEYTPAKLRAAGDDPDALLAHLRDRGFGIHQINRRGALTRLEPGQAVAGLRRPIGRYFLSLLAFRT